MSPPNEPYLKDYICSNCHVGLLQAHPEEKFAIQNFVKCGLCGFTKKLEVKKNPLHSVLFGKDNGSK